MEITKQLMHKLPAYGKEDVSLHSFEDGQPLIQLRQVALIINGGFELIRDNEWHDIKLDESSSVERVALPEEDFVRTFTNLLQAKQDAIAFSQNLCGKIQEAQATQHALNTPGLYVFKYEVRPIYLLCLDIIEPSEELLGPRSIITKAVPIKYKANDESDFIELTYAFEDGPWEDFVWQPDIPPIDLDHALLDLTYGFEKEHWVNIGQPKSLFISNIYRTLNDDGTTSVGVVVDASASGILDNLPKSFFAAVEPELIASDKEILVVSKRNDKKNHTIGVPTSLQIVKP